MEELTVLGKVYLRVTDYYTQTKVFQSFAVPNLFELESTALEDALDPGQKISLMSLQQGQMNNPLFTKTTVLLFEVLVEDVSQYFGDFDHSFLQGFNFMMRKFILQLISSLLLVILLVLLCSDVLLLYGLIEVRNCPKLHSYPDVFVRDVQDRISLAKRKSGRMHRG